MRSLRLHWRRVGHGLFRRYKYREVRLYLPLRIKPYQQFSLNPQKIAHVTSKIETIIGEEGQLKTKNVNVQPNLHQKLEYLRLLSTT